MPYKGSKVQSPSPKRVTLAQLADYCNLSKSTVSRILNRRSGEFPIRPETMTEVFKAAEELGYRRNRLARAVASQRTHLIGLSLPTLPEHRMKAEAFVTPVSHHFISAVFAHPLFASYDLVIHKRDQDLDMMDGDDLLDGLLYVDPEGKSGDLLKKVLGYVPVVVMGTIPDSESWLVSVDINNRSVGKVAAQHLFDRGAEEMLIIIPESYADFGCFNQRESGFLKKASSLTKTKEHGVSVRVGDDVESIRLAIRPHLKRKAKLGIFLAEDRHCSALLQALELEKTRVPEDVLLLSMGTEGHEPTSQNGVTTVDVPLYDIAAKATDLLLKILTGESPYEPEAHQVPEKLSVRGSTGR